MTPAVLYQVCWRIEGNFDLTSTSFRIYKLTVLTVHIFFLFMFDILEYFGATYFWEDHATLHVTVLGHILGSSHLILFSGWAYLKIVASLTVFWWQISVWSCQLEIYLMANFIPKIVQIAQKDTIFGYCSYPRNFPPILLDLFHTNW